MTKQELARAAAAEASSTHAVGDFLEAVNENEPNVTTYLFDSRLKGYVGWRWSISLFEDGDEVTISEVNLIAGENSVLAPKWVPWSERLADYKALQAALELQAAEEAAALAEEAATENSSEDGSNGEESSDDDDFEEVEEIGVDDVDEYSAPASGDDQTQKSEGDTEDASEEPTSFFRIFRRNKKRK